MLAKLESEVIATIRGERKEIWTPALRFGLRLSSFFYGAAVNLRNLAYRLRIFKAIESPIRIISVGNITSGGSGKTPLTLLLAKSLAKNNRVAILSRGYRAEIQSDVPILLKGDDAGVFGDEAALLAQHLPSVSVIVGKKRSESAQVAAKLACTLAILDDGMQHRQLKRDYEIVAIDANDPFGKGKFLPAGFLRESPRALARADLIVINHAKNAEHYESVKERLLPYSKATIMGTSLSVSCVEDINSKEEICLKKKKVAMLCGIASPAAFRETLQSLEAEIVAECILRDHEAINKETLLAFAQRAKAAEASIIVCTEKDAIKIKKIRKLTSLPIVQVLIELNLRYDAKRWTTIINKEHKQ
jgi:tetraacyldisaccharide 4'-kinase